MLRYGGYVLNLRSLITASLTAEDQFTMLALDQSSGRNQKAFAVCKHSVAVSYDKLSVQTSEALFNLVIFVFSLLFVAFSTYTVYQNYSKCLPSAYVFSSHSTFLLVYLPLCN